MPNPEVVFFPSTKVIDEHAQGGHLSVIFSDTESFLQELPHTLIVVNGSQSRNIHGLVHSADDLCFLEYFLHFAHCQTHKEISYDYSNQENEQQKDELQSNVDIDVLQIFDIVFSLQKKC